MTDLSWYPRPETGCGFHDSANKYANPSDVEAHARRLKAIGITVYKLLCDGANKVDRARIYKEYGIEPVIRLYSQGPHPGFRPDPVILKQYYDVGVRYVEWGNEPNIGDIEWSNWPGIAEAPLLVARQARVCHTITKDEGMVPMFPAMTPGGYINHRQFYIECVGEIVSRGWGDIFDKSALAVHPRPLNHPPNLMPDYKSAEELGHPPMDTGLWEINWIHDYFVEALGWCPPMIATEAGYSIGDSQDANYPRIDEHLHYVYNRQMFEFFREGWPDWFLGACYWLESEGGAWQRDTLWSNWASSGPLNPLAGWLDAGNINWTRGESAPDPHAFKIYDIEGNQQGKAWLDQVWGVQVEFGDGDKLVELREVEGPATQIVAVIDQHGQPIDGIMVHRTWPSGSTEGVTVNGEVGFGLGRGDYITAPGEGVSSVWTNGDRVSGLGMIAGTEHRALRVVFQLVGSEIDETVREHAYRSGGIPYNPEAAFPHFARENDLGNPVTREFDFVYEEKTYRGQGFSRGIVYAEAGKWDDIKIVEW